MQTAAMTQWSACDCILHSCVAHSPGQSGCSPRCLCTVNRLVHAGVEGLELVAELQDVAHGSLTGTGVAVGRVRVSPPAWPQTSTQSLHLHWVLQDGVRAPACSLMQHHTGAMRAVMQL